MKQNAVAKKTAKDVLHYIRFSSGTKTGRIHISPSVSKSQRVALDFWIRRLPGQLTELLPLIKLAVVETLTLAQGGVIIDERVATTFGQLPENTHAVSFIPDRYIVLSQSLFRHRIEVGRIFYHELCHFLWPRLGNRKRGDFEKLLRQELRDRTRGDLGYSAETRKAELLFRKKAVGPAKMNRQLREYACESFCDTGAYVLLGGERRRNHSEFTLRGRARQRRCDLWTGVVLETKKHSRPDPLIVE